MFKEVLLIKERKTKIITQYLLVFKVKHFKFTNFRILLKNIKLKNKVVLNFFLLRQQAIQFVCFVVNI